jgi:carbon monoxide dehydrogenase subunit G
MEISCSKAINAPAEKVWAIMTNLEGFPDAISGIENVERLDDGNGFEIGTTWRETRTLFGRTATEDMWVTELEPGRSYVVEANSHGAEYRTTQSVKPDGDAGSVLSMSFSGKPTGTMAKVMSATIGRFFVNATRRTFEKDLSDIASAAEGSL